MAYAQENNCNIIIANDPDADRLGLAEFNTKTNTWRILTGNEIGVLLGHYQIQQYKDNGGVKGVVLASVVSSRMLKHIALSEGIKYYDTLTGICVYLYVYISYI